MSTPRSLLLPAGVRRERVATQRGRFAGLVAGSTGPVRGAVLLIPGFTGSKEDFAPLLPLLAAAGWWAVAYDQRGQYESPGTGVGAYTLEALAADASAIAAAAAPRGVERHLVGHSFGGLVAQTAVLADPSAWRSLTLMCSGPGGLGAGDQTSRLLSLVRLLESTPLDVVHESMQADDRRRGKRPPAPEIAAFLRTRFRSNTREGLREMAALLMGTPDRVDEVARTGLPCAVVRGADDDAWAHRVQDEMAAGLGTTTTVLPGAAHSPAVENPVETARVLCEFLAAV